MASKQLQRIIHMLAPNVAVLGYALFLAINAAGVWGGVFPFLPEDFQTSDILLSFFMAQALTFAISYFVSVLGVYYVPGPTRRFLVFAAAIPYFLGWCALIAAIYVDDCAIALVTVGGGLLGVGSAGFYMLWQRLFASQDADTGNRNLIAGTAWGALFYFALYAIPQAVTAFLIPLVFLPLFGLAIVLQSRTIDLDQPMFQDKPHAHPRVYRALLHDYWRSALCIGALGFCAGIMRSLAVGDVSGGVVLNIMSMAAALVLAVALLGIWQSNDLRINLSTACRVFFPFIITGFLLLPFFGDTISRTFASLVYAAYSCGTVLMMVQCAQASRDRGINPIFIYGFVGGIVYALHDIGFIAGTFTEHMGSLGVDPMACVSLIAIYLLGLMFFVGQGGFKRVLSSRTDDAAYIELIALNAPAGSAINVAENEDSETSSAYSAHPIPNEIEHQEERDHIQFRDRISKQCAALQQHYRLSAREAEVMEYIARGNSVAHIAEELVVSENTIRTHSKRIYAKLDIHKKQELMDLVDQFEPSDLS